MSDQPAPHSRARRFWDQSTHSPSIFGTGTVFKGELQCGGDLAIAGTVTGEGNIQGSLTLADSAHWEGTVQASNAILAGTIKGRLVVTGKLEIRKSAHVQGTIEAKSIAIAKGAIIDGEMKVLGTTPVVHFIEKRG